MNTKHINEFFLKILNSRPVITALRLIKPSRNPFPSSLPQKILFIKLEGIGDSVYILEIIKRLKAAYPSVEIDVLTTARNPLFRIFDNPAACLRFGVKTLEPLNPLSYFRAVKDIGAAGYDAVFDMTGMPVNIPLMLLFVKTFKAGFSSTELRRETYDFRTDIDPGIHIFDNYLKLTEIFFHISSEKKFTLVPDGFPENFAAGIGNSKAGTAIPARTPDTSNINLFELPANGRHICLVLSSGGGGNMGRKLPTANASLLLELLSERFADSPLYLLGGPEDYPYLESLITGLRLKPHLSKKVFLKRTESLIDALRLLKGSLFNICIDSGLMHLSSIVNSDTYCLFGYSSPLNSLPFNNIGYFSASCPCAPCSFYRISGCKTLECMGMIDVNKVADDLSGRFLMRNGKFLPEAKNTKRQNYNFNLHEIKSARLSEIETLAASSLKRKIKKVKYLLNYGMPARKFFQYALSYFLVFPFIKTWTISRQNAIKRKYFGNDENICYIAVNIGNAGIGDAIVAVRFIRDMAYRINKNKISGSKLVFNVFYRTPESIKFITEAEPSIRSVMNLNEYDYFRNFYDADFRLNAFLVSQKIRKKSQYKVSAKFPALVQIIENIKNNQKNIEKYIKTRPFSEGILADKVTLMGLSRETYLNYAAGLKGNEEINAVSSKSVPIFSSMPYNRLQLSIHPSEVSKFNLNREGIKFITIHDGWDENTRTKNKTGVSTKSYPPEKWAELVKLIKIDFPEYLIVQLGGLGNGSNIDGADINLRGKTTLKEAASIISSSTLHIDTDSGLVHIAACLGTPSAVLFGPTNAAYCSYKGNINIAPNLCGNCWWSIDDWMDTCPRGLKTAECMYSIEPKTIIEKIKSKLYDAG